jgi:MFS family permease
VGGRLAVGISVTWVALAFLGDGLSALVLPSVVASAPDAATSLGLITFVGLGLAVAAQPLAGRLSDRLRGWADRRWYMAAAAIPTLIGLAILARSEGVIWLAALGYFGAVLAASGIQAALQTLIPEHVPAGRRGRAASLKTAFDIGGAFVAFLVLGWALETAGIVGAAAVTALVLVLALTVVFVWVPSVAGPAPVPHRGEIPAEVGAGRSIPGGFWSLVLSRFLFLLGIFIVGRFLLFLVAERLVIPAGSAAGETGGLLAMFTLVTAIAAIVVGPLVDRGDRRRLMAAGAVAAGVGIAVYLAPAGLPGVVTAGTLMSIGTAIFVTANWASLTDLAPAEDAGRLMGVANIGTGGAAACAGLLGPAIDAWGFAPALVLAMASALVALVPLARTTRGRVARLEESTT